MCVVHLVSGCLVRVVGMLGLFVIGGVIGAASASVALVLGASWASAVLAYFAAGSALPLAGIVHGASQTTSQDPQVFDVPQDSFEDTLSQWDADPESRSNQYGFGAEDEDDERNNKVA